MSSDPTYGPKIRLVNGGDGLDVAPGAAFGTYDGAAVTLVAPAATAATNSTPYGFSQAQADAIITWIRAVDARLKLMGTAQ